MPPSFHLAQLDGLRYPLCAGVVAINMGLYNAGANTPVGVFLVLSGLTSFLAYGTERWDDASRAQFFLRRLWRLLPMLLVSMVFQLCSYGLWVFCPGVIVDRTDSTGSSGGRFSFVVHLFSFVLILAGSGAVCRGTACGCCRIDRWPRPPCALFPLIFGTYLAGPAWYVGLLLFLNAYFVPKLLATYGEAWRASPPSWIVLMGWASLEGLQYGLPLLLYAATQSVDAWHYATLYIYLGAPPLFRLVTFVFGLQLGRWASHRLEAASERTDASRTAAEAITLVPVLATALIVTSLHGFLQPETEMHRPDTGSTPLQWAIIHLIHPFTVLALFCGLVAAPHSLVARFLASPPLAKLAELSYAVYLLQLGVINIYVFSFNKKWVTELESLYASADAAPLNAFDYFAVVLLSTALAYPATHWIEPRVAAWVQARVEAPSPPKGEML